MGRDKASLVLAGKTLAERAVDRLHMVCADVQLCGWSGKGNPPAPVLPDLLPDAGPLAALVAALIDANQCQPGSLAVVLAVDLPLLPWEMLDWLAARAQFTQAHATIPVVGDRPQPLCAIYSSTLALALRSQLAAGERKLTRAIEAACPAKRYDRVTLAEVLPPARHAALPEWFLNLNTPEDLLAAEQAWPTRRVW